MRWRSWIGRLIGRKQFDYQEDREMIYPQVSSALPPDATTKLVAASKVKPTPDDRLARAKAIDAAIRYARLWYPHLFRHDEISP